MQTLMLVSVVGIVAVILATLLRRTNGELALLVTLGACVVMGFLVLQWMEPLVEFLSTLRKLSGLEPELMNPLLKTIGIGFLTQICATVCADAGENAIARTVELCGNVLALYVALPLLQAVIDLMQRIGGGA